MLIGLVEAEKSWFSYFCLFCRKFQPFFQDGGQTVNFGAKYKVDRVEVMLVGFSDPKNPILGTKKISL